MSESTPASLALANMGIPFKEFIHTGPIHSLEQAASERGQSPSQIIRSILFRLGQGEFVMVLVAGPRQISWPKLRGFLGQSRITMASDEEVFEVTGFRPGAVSPFGLPSLLRILADDGVFIPEEVSIGSGVRGTAIVIKTSDLKTALGSIETGQFV